MRVLLYFQDIDTIKKSGIGRALSHQMRALSSAGIEYTTNKRDDFDIAHINTYWAKSHRVLRYCKKKGIPVIVHGHSTHEDFADSFTCWKLIHPIYNRQLDYMYPKADLIIAPTEYAKNLIDGYGFNVPVKVISNGIDPAEYAEDVEAQEAFLKRFSLKKGDKFVMGIGFPFVRKGLPDFFEVARAFPEVKFIWFGALSKALQTRAIRKAIRHKPENAVMAGYCSGKTIHGAFQTASAMFFPSHEETEGIVVLEALASKTPLVIRDIGVYSDWLTDGVDCHKGKTNGDFIRILKGLLENGEESKILENGYKKAEERSLGEVGAALKEAYEGLLQ